MALIATLQFGDNDARLYTKNYLVVDYHSSFRRSHNDLRPDGLAECDSVELEVVAPALNDLTLHDWFIDEDEMSGRIVFGLSSSASNATSPTRELLFEGARCFLLEERYDKDTRFRRLLKLAFEAETITIENIDFKKRM